MSSEAVGTAAAKSPEGSDAGKKKAAPRSPSYPFINLETAVARAGEFWAEEKQHSAPKAVAFSHWKYASKSSGAQRTLAALKAYGLLVDSGGRLQLTPRALKIVVPGSPERAQALQEAALSPPEFKWLWGKYKESLPSPDTLQHELVIERGYSEAAVNEFTSNYRETLRFAGLSGSAIMVEPKSDNGQTPLSGHGGAMQSQIHAAPPPPPLQPVGSLPPVTFPLPRGNMVEIRLKSRVTAKEFAQLKQLLDILGPSLIENEGEEG
jgi:hypothetical protein